VKSRKSRKGKASAGERATAGVPTGVVGLGLMGISIATCLLAAGHPVAGIDLDGRKRRSAAGRIRALLEEMRRQKLLRERPVAVLRRFAAADDYAALRDAQVVVEAITENVETKKRVIASVEAAVGPATIIGSNTSAIPISLLQKDAAYPERVLGTHWAEPAHVTRFMEIICGEQTDPQNAECVRVLSRFWGKEASIVRRDIRGFITNRCMYALLREAFHLVESGYATIEDVDRSLRNDFGYWITFAGPFRYMDLTGVPAYETVMRDLLPELCRSTEVPRLISDVVKSGAQGVANARGFYKYTPASARRWEKRFLEFTYDIRALALKYPGDSGERAGARPRAGKTVGQ
jgi:3-hydroxybutyryl-CoA dehydrogenase